MQNQKEESPQGRIEMWNAHPTRLPMSTPDSEEQRKLRQAREVLNYAADLYLLLDERGQRVLDHNESASSQLGYERAELRSLSPAVLFPQLTELQLERELTQLIASTEKSACISTLVMRRDGSVFAAELQLRAMEDPDGARIGVIVREVSDIAQTQSELLRVKRALAMTSSITKSILTASNEDELLSFVCHDIARIGSFAAVFGLSRPFTETERFCVYQDLDEPLDFMGVLNDIGLEETEQDDIINAAHSSPVFKRGKQKLVRRAGGLPKWTMPKYGSLVYLPMQRGDKITGALCIVTKKQNMFDEQEIEMLQKCANEVAYGIASQRQETARRKAEATVAQRLRIEQAISKYSTDLLTCPSFEQGAKTGLQRLLLATAADQAFLYEVKDELHEPKTAEKLCELFKGRKAPHKEAPPTFKLDPFASGQASRPFSDSLSSGQYDEFQFDEGDEVLVFPLKSGERCLGLVGFIFYQGSSLYDPPTEAMLRFAVELMGELHERFKTSRKLNLLATAMDNTDEGVFIADADGPYADASIVLVNQGMCRLTGYTKTELLNAAPKLLLPNSEAIIPDKIIAELKAGRMHRGKANYRRKDGSSYLSEFALYPIFDNDGAFTKYLCIHRDITEKNQMETRLAFANKMESVGQLSAGIAHEINTPSQFIGDNLRYLQDAWERISPIMDEAIGAARVKGEQRWADRAHRLVSGVPGAIGDACEGVERIASIVKAMREFSHPEKSFVLSDINKNISTTVTVARNEWKYVSELDLDLDGNLPLVEIMPGEINQVLLNLIVNAAHAIEEKSGQNGRKGSIRISSRRADKCVRVSISDTGKGIPMRARENIFDPFFTTKEVGKGTGQGLFMAHTIIEKKHKGRLWFESEEGNGTTFHFDLPTTVDITDESNN